MMIVQKYGGTSVANTERILNVAKRCLETQRAGNQVAVVVSAMAIIERVNDSSWMLFYVCTSLMTIPSVLLLLFYSKKYKV